MMFLDDLEQLNEFENESETLKRIDYIKSQEKQHTKNCNIFLQDKIKEELQSILSIDRDLVHTLNNGSVLIRELVRLYRKIYQSDDINDLSLSNADISCSQMPSTPTNSISSVTKKEGDDFSLIRNRSCDDNVVSASKLRFGSYMCEDFDRFFKVDTLMEELIQERVSASHPLDDDFMIKGQLDLPSTVIDEIKRLMKCSQISKLADIEMEMDIAGIEGQISWLEENLTLSDSEFDNCRRKADYEGIEMKDRFDRRLKKLSALCQKLSHSNYYSIESALTTCKLQSIESLLNSQKEAISLILKQRAWYELLILLLKFEEATHQSIKEHLENIRNELSALKERHEQIIALLSLDVPDDRVKTLKQRNDPLVLACQLIEEMKIPISLLDDRLADKEIEKLTDKLSSIRRNEAQSDDNLFKLIEEFSDLVSGVIDNVLLTPGSDNDRPRILLSSLPVVQQMTQWRDKILKCKQEMDLLVEDLRAVNIY